MSFQDSPEPCPHCWDEQSVRKPSLTSKVYKDECMYCYTSNVDTIYVCMKSFRGMCKQHLPLHQPAENPLLMEVRKLPKPEQKEPITDLSQLGVEPPDEFETKIVCLPCKQRFELGVGVTAEAAKAIEGALSPQLQQTIADMKANENAFAVECPHAKTMVQPENRVHSPSNPPVQNEKCASCDHTVNNWMCLFCGSIGCPRKEAGGQEHAILHYMMTGHPVVVKTGTITPAGADLYCYACDDDVKDPNLKEHLQALGINMNTAVKTAKSMAEMQLDQTAKLDFGLITEANKKLVPRYGPGHTGFINLGNSCYMASILQAVLSMPEFEAKLKALIDSDHQATCTKNPAECYLCQLQKLGQGYYSGEYSGADLPKHRQGIAPRDFKTFITEGHPDFSTGVQQDAEEFFRYMLQTMSRKEIAYTSSPTLAEDPTKLFEFVVEERKQCTSCNKVRYTRTLEPSLCFAIPVPHPEDPTAVVKDEDRPRRSLDDCLDHYLLPGDLECKCEGCGSAAVYTTTSRMATFPEVLVMHPRREYLDHKAYVTRKLSVHVTAPEEIDLERIRGTGLQSGEVELPATTVTAAAASDAPVDEIAFATVLSMGIDDATAKWALQNTDNNVERAVEWVFSHPEGPPSAAPAAAETTPAAPAPEVKAATDGSPKYELFAMVSHMGATALMGHYVAHVKKDGKWSLCNDEKVAFSEDPPFSMASIYFYRRKK